MARLPPRQGLPGLPGGGGAGAPALLERARRAHAAGDLAGAARAYEQVVVLEPGHVAALNALGNLAVARRDYDAALRWHRRALATAPRDPALLNDLANALTLGDRAEEAVPLLRKALRAAPDLRAAQLNLARAYRELDRPADALSVLDRLERSSGPGDPDLALERAVLLSQTGAGGAAAALFRAVLKARPTNVRALDGLATCRKAAPEPGDMALAEAALDAPGSVPRTRSVAPLILEHAAERAGKARRTVDKMPHNFLLLGWIAMLFPEARIIHCTREALDVCVSCYTHHLADTHAYTRDLATLGAYWRTYAAVMAHWHRALAPGRILDVGYEELVAGVEGAARKVIAHLGLAWDARCLAYADNRRVVRTPSQWQVRQPLYSSSIGRWRRFERHLGPLLAALGRGG